ncbi:NUDIX domain-containing protein [Paenalkalicoccus suaedae]|uniref:NUDIX domain-containing protein n=2 Tax=Paenalkalicoccus suaedae TaxID=2592382 RepID=A0A859FKL7_9BACI|nr:NUDIX domain-containing protein [Paenalkalicoccus suaedae]QKS73326.1 NUDIX domain-containing protein [Paenalkalicoccus suaedae]
MELWDIYDAHRNKTGRQIERGADFKPGDYHLVVHVAIFNDNNEMLIQQRQQNRDNWPSLWDISMGGSALAGETSQQAAERELFEELGIRLSFKNRRPTLTANFDRGFDDFYVINYPVQIEDLPLPTDEVQRARFATCDDILELIEQGIFLPHSEAFIRLLFATKTDTGMHNWKNFR